MDLKNNKYKELDSLEIGTKWEYPQCFYCKYDKNAFCSIYNKDRMDVEADIFNCPFFKKKNNTIQKAKGDYSKYGL